MAVDGSPATSAVTCTELNDRGKPLRRRDILAAGLTLPLAGRPLYDAMVSQAFAQDKSVPFEAATVRAYARELARATALLAQLVHEVDDLLLA